MREGHEDPGEAFVDVEADLERLVRRLRGLSPAAWRSRRQVVDDLLTDLEQFAATLDGRPRKTVPALTDYARADAVAVLGGDAVAAYRDAGEGANISRLTARIGVALDQTL